MAESMNSRFAFQARVALVALCSLLVVSTADAATRSMTGHLSVDNPSQSKVGDPFFGPEGGPAIYGRKVGIVGATLPPTDGAKSIDVERRDHREPSSDGRSR